jgi:hypothetical protein
VQDASLAQVLKQLAELKREMLQASQRAAARERELETASRERVDRSRASVSLNAVRESVCACVRLSESDCWCACVSCLVEARHNSCSLAVRFILAHAGPEAFAHGRRRESARDLVHCGCDSTRALAAVRHSRGHAHDVCCGCKLAGRVASVRTYVLR